MQDHYSGLQRLNNISLGPFERRVLPKMARALPSWVMPDHLTFGGQLAAALIGLAYWLTTFDYNWLWLANAGFVLHWAADSLDGTLARVRQIQRERYGFFVDHYSDAVAVLLIGVGVGVSPLMSLPVALMLVIAYYAMMMLVYLVSLSRDVFKISFAGVGPTEFRLVAIIANTVVWALDNPTVAIYEVRTTLFTLLGTFLFVILLAFFFIFGEIERRRLAKADPTPHHSPPGWAAHPQK